MIMKIVFIVPISFTLIESLLSVQWGRRMSIGNSPPESQRKLSIIRLKFPDLYPSRERVSSVLLYAIRITRDDNTLLFIFQLA